MKIQPPTAFLSTNKLLSFRLIENWSTFHASEFLRRKAASLKEIWFLRRWVLFLSSAVPLAPPSIWYFEKYWSWGALNRHFKSRLRKQPHNLCKRLLEAQEILQNLSLLPTKVTYVTTWPISFVSLVPFPPLSFTADFCLPFPYMEKLKTNKKSQKQSPNRACKKLQL